jgi:hypothetical protein
MAAAGRPAGGDQDSTEPIATAPYEMAKLNIMAERADGARPQAESEGESSSQSSSSSVCSSRSSPAFTDKLASRPEGSTSVPFERRPPAIKRDRSAVADGGQPSNRRPTTLAAAAGRFGRQEGNCFYLLRAANESRRQRSLFERA